MLFRTSCRLFAGILVALSLLVGSIQPALADTVPGDNPAPDVESSSVNTTAVSYRALLPMITSYKYTAYTGRATFKGAAAPHLTVRMYYTTNDWASSTLFAQTTTDASGYFRFSNLPQVGYGRAFGVEWENPDDNYTYPHLQGWLCNDVKGLPGDKYTCSFDIQDVAIKAPAHNVSVSLPYTFSWARRTTTTDQYEVNWWDPDLEHYLWTAKLPYAGAFTLTSIPDFFYTGFPYNWSVDVYGPDGFGISYWYRWVAFMDRFSPPLDGIAQTSDLLANTNAEEQSSLRMNPRLQNLDSSPAEEGTKSLTVQGN